MRDVRTPKYRYNIRSFLGVICSLGRVRPGFICVDGVDVGNGIPDLR
jgi:hypothetical protein